MLTFRQVWRVVGVKNIALARRMATSVEPQTALTNGVPEREVEEFTFNVPWGNVAGKWWGPRNTRPIVCIHGWQDNAGSFDTLIPQLPTEYSYLALDLPGHGYSSRLPHGIFYSWLDISLCLRLLADQEKWDKISLLGHSMSSLIGFSYSSTFPDKVDLMIGIDALKPHVRPAEKYAPMIERGFEAFLKANQQNEEGSEPPSYTYDDILERLHKGTNGSVTKEACPYLLKRAIAKSKDDPEKYFYTRDNRLKGFNFVTLSQEIAIEMTKRIKCPYMFVKCTNSVYYEDKKYVDEIIEVFRENNPNFEYHTIQGKHHAHLNEPHKFTDILTAFIRKHRKP
ncbi:probable serine hydrolase isoform X1 [Lutzomyia longipalpis]|uniref:probable serine hydrolase isoform X1 n=1 Tax=Lutzomyia longipalpis TaxID=7200 RepID=UPI002483BC45|nr:probable serine hydrolase isoform X1 [Lutzomyia longipalpis]